MKKTLIIDNYDSFTYNLVQYVGELQGNPIVYRNDEVELKDIKQLQPTHIIISPGPGNPTDKNYFGICNEIIESFYKTTPLLGVCLGHQGIAAHFGANIISAPEVRHGKQSSISHNGDNLFQDVPLVFQAMRYHSLLVDQKSIPKGFEVIAQTQSDQLIMAIKHKKYPLYGIQFHPESIGTQHGKSIIQNFLNI
jgi:anthranilate synthase component 2